MTEQNSSEQEENTQSEAGPYINLRSCGVGWRVAAFFIDSAICTFIFANLFSLGFLLFGDTIADEILREVARSGAENLDSVEHLGTTGAIASVVFSLLYALLLVLYGAVSESSHFAATPGKLMMGLRVCTLEGHQLYFSDGFARNLYKHLMMVCSAVLTAASVPLSLSSPLLGGVLMLCSTLILIALLIYSIVDPLYAFFSMTNQTLHDKWAYTLVVKEEEVNRFGRLIVGVIGVLFLGFMQTLVSGIMLASAAESMYTKLQNAGLLELEEAEMEMVEPLTTDPSTQPAELTVKERIALALAKAKKEAEERAKEVEKAAETPVPSPSPKEKKPKDYTPHVDGAAVINKSSKIVPPIPNATPVREHHSGAVKIGSRKFDIKDTHAALSSNRRVVVLNFYDAPVSQTRRVYLRNNFKAALTDPNVVLRFKIIFSKYGDNCSDSALQKYIIDVNVKKAGVPYKSDFYSFDRGGNLIISKEYLDFDCRRQKNGFVGAELRGSTSFLLSGRRVPVIWNSEVTAKFSGDSKKE